MDLAELHSFRLVYFKHKEIFLVVCIVSDGSSVLSIPVYRFSLIWSPATRLETGIDQIRAVRVGYTVLLAILIYKISFSALGKYNTYSRMVKRVKAVHGLLCFLLVLGVKSGNRIC